ncbi:CocE/NonD family hydrolase [Magnetospirillum sp. 15-1]|uniref:CocE/NonD family hydrolase n=1 Tax=Magnetospirillum sp. 15-1 TaxID=1979370 RepID=UPI000BBCCB81|nr:CocE/NonD family hydrolase [Magnetospirillum sp. 15-1]
MDKRRSTYSGDESAVVITGHKSKGHAIPYGTKVDGVLFDGYPQLVKEQGSATATYRVLKEKDVMVAMRDGVRIAVDIYRPENTDEKFPAILAWGVWGKDTQEAVGWQAEFPQPYYDSALWDGTMEAGDYNFTVPRGYIHVIPDPRGIGNSEGYGTPGKSPHDPEDIYDLIEWLAVQPWCNGKVGMMGPSSYSIAQMKVAPLRPPHLVALHPDGNPCGNGDYFHGIYDTLPYHILIGRHGNDSCWVPPNYAFTPPEPFSMSLPDIKERIAEAKNHPDIKYNSKMYSHIVYPRKHPVLFDTLIYSFHPRPFAPYNPIEHFGATPHLGEVTLPMYVGTPWLTRLYIWSTFESWDSVGTPEGQKKLFLPPPGDSPRPYAEYHDETLRWYDYWLKGIDTGVMDEPPIKMFVMGINKWRFENEWPLKRTEWTKYYLQSGGGLSPTAGSAGGTESFTQPAANVDPTVYCLRYTTEPLAEDTEITGPIALHLEASIDIDDTNWMADLVDIAPDGSRRLISLGFLKAAFRAIDPARSKPYRPVHPKQDPVPVTPGQVVGYDIAMMPTANVFKKGHRIELVIRNQDDLHSRLGTWGVYHLPFMRSVTHTIHFGQSHVLLPLVPAQR